MARPLGRPRKKLFRRGTLSAQGKQRSISSTRVRAQEFEPLIFSNQGPTPTHDPVNPGSDGGLVEPEIPQDPQYSLVEGLVGPYSIRNTNPEVNR